LNGLPQQYRQAIHILFSTIAAMIGIIMGSASDLKIMVAAADILEQLLVKYEVTIVSAHRTPERLFDYAQNAASRGIKAIIAGAGGAAHLPGMVASISYLPIIGVPIKSENSMDGWDSVLSILQMPGGIPVATVSLNGALNAGLLAAQMLSISDPALVERLKAYKESLKTKVITKALELEKGDFRDHLN